MDISASLSTHVAQEEVYVFKCNLDKFLLDVVFL